MISKVELYLNNLSIRNRRIIVALSGGPDSISLLYLLNHLKYEYDLIIEAAYVDHGIRCEKENFLDCELIKRTCSDLNILLHIKSFSIGELEKRSKNESSSIEAVARNVRYDFFDSLAEKDTLIALGHNRDDQIETQIMRFFQGSSLDGLIGIKDNRLNLIRPLISVSKKEILDYLDVNNILYRVDITNNNTDYLRNKVRNNLIPLISEIFPGFRGSLKKLEEDFKDYKREFDKFYPKINWKNKGKTFFCDYSTFMSYPLFKRKEEIYRIFDISYSGKRKDFRLPNRFLSSLEKEKFNNNEIILEGYGFKLQRRDRELIWCEKNKLEHFFKIKVTGEKRYINSKVDFYVSNNKDGFFISELTYPFNVRTKLDGFAENKILKKSKCPLDYNKLILIIEKYNTLYAIIYNNEVVFSRFKSEEGLYIDFKKGF